ncbi:MAG: hypothetical protein MHPSP_000516, partial [Paramarteilia canceri]
KIEEDLDCMKNLLNSGLEKESNKLQKQIILVSNHINDDIGIAFENFKTNRLTAIGSESKKMLSFSFRELFKILSELDL